jgi:hypothetical protein
VSLSRSADVVLFDASAPIRRGAATAHQQNQLIVYDVVQCLRETPWRFKRCQCHDYFFRVVFSVDTCSAEQR